MDYLKKELFPRDHHHLPVFLSLMAVMIGLTVAVVAFQNTNPTSNLHASNENVTFTVADPGSACNPATATNVKDSRGNTLTCVNNILTLSGTDIVNNPIDPAALQAKINTIPDNSSEINAIENELNTVNDSNIDTTVPDESSPGDDSETDL